MQHLDFPCTGCGLCCQKAQVIIDAAKEHKDPIVSSAAHSFPYIFDLDGTCEMYQEGKCQVYKSRPLICRVRDLGDRVGMDREVNFKMTAEICNHLIKAHGLPDSYIVQLD
jgi:Fe-S-cluster containining protein